jgi:trans-aconitate methyltransferase
VDRVDLRQSEPHPARVYDYLLGGKDNYAVDREVAEQMISALPGIRETAWANRRFMLRSARHLARDLGIRQFLDIGTGLPTTPNLHEVVQEVDPAARVVYVDNDPIVLVNARALLTGAPEGAISYVQADLSDPDSILDSPQVRQVLDLSRPVAVSLIAILHFIVDQEEAGRIVRRLLAPMAPGSVLSVSVLTFDGVPEEMAGVMAAANQRGIPARPRTLAEVQSLVQGLDVLEPGAVRVNRWHPDADEPATGRDVPVYGVVAVKSQDPSSAQVG